MASVRLLLLPFSLLYGLAVWVRNRFYDWGWIRSKTFDKPVIVVGNLAVGGTGKSPMTEYLVRILAEHYRVATLSRGYGRKTSGFLKVEIDASPSRCGDEPLQFKRKFPHITVAVSEDRVLGVQRLIDEGHEVVVLDDAYQHRALRPGLAILLFDYRTIGKPKWLLPAGNYRDWFRERRRAHILVVTKTPRALSIGDKAIIRDALAPRPEVPVLFSSIDYRSLIALQPGPPTHEAVLHAQLSVLLVTGIANPAPLYEYLAAHTKEVLQLRYPDHHPYTAADVRKMIDRFDAIGNPRKLIITTEKDAQRLSIPSIAQVLAGLPVYLLPIHAVFDDTDGERLRQAVLTYCQQTLATHRA